jgi:DNA (cytosine-5)-methyltransferase 1
MIRLLDLFCGAGGAAEGYRRAGFTVIVGVDNKPQPRYPFEFVQADALEYVADHGLKFDLIHASPPCHHYSSLQHLHPLRSYPDLIDSVRQLLKDSGRPYVIENVVGAPLIHPVKLCGVMFGLKVFRHRLFETNPWLMSPPHPKHPGIAGTHRYPYVGDYLTITGTGGNYKLEEGKKAMDIDWMNRSELSQAIPPAYTEWLGRQLINSVIRNPQSEMETP